MGKISQGAKLDLRSTTNIYCSIDKYWRFGTVSFEISLYILNDCPLILNKYTSRHDNI